MQQRVRHRSSKGGDVCRTRWEVAQLLSRLPRGYIARARGEQLFGQMLGKFIERFCRSRPLQGRLHHSPGASGDEWDRKGYGLGAATGEETRPPRAALPGSGAPPRADAPGGCRRCAPLVGAPPDDDSTRGGSVQRGSASGTECERGLPVSCLRRVENRCRGMRILADDVTPSCVAECRAGRPRRLRRLRGGPLGRGAPRKAKKNENNQDTRNIFLGMHITPQVSGSGPCRDRA